MPATARASNPDPDFRKSTSENSTSGAVAFHDQTAADWDRRYTQGSFRTRQAAFEHCLPLNQLAGLWLDAGCGSGPLARFLVNRGMEFQPVDLSPRMLELFAQHRKDHPAKDLLREPLLADVGNLPFPAGSFRGVICSSVLEYVEDPGEVLAEFHRVLQPDGWLAVSVPNRVSLLRRGLEAALAVTRKFGKPWPAYLQFSRHRYTITEFQQLLRTRGFKPNSFSGCGTSLPGLKSTSFGWSLLVFGAIKKA
jgi:ubiquinone/menaquinone biosynthesis C-methylase UbiE